MGFGKKELNQEELIANAEELLKLADKCQKKLHLEISSFIEKIRNIFEKERTILKKYNLSEEQNFEKFCQQLDRLINLLKNKTLPTLEEIKLIQAFSSWETELLKSLANTLAIYENRKKVRTSDEILQATPGKFRQQMTTLTTQLKEVKKDSTLWHEKEVLEEMIKDTPAIEENGRQILARIELIHKLQKVSTSLKLIVQQRVTKNLFINNFTHQIDLPNLFKITIQEEQISLEFSEGKTLIIGLIDLMRSSWPKKFGGY